MHLLQKHRLRPRRDSLERRLQYLPIGLDCCGQVTDVIADIEAIKRRSAHAAGAGRTQRMDMGGCWPIRAQQSIGSDVVRMHCRSVRRGIDSVAHWQLTKNR